MDFEFVAVKDVEGSLWKAAHYRLIEDFRKKLSVASKKDPGVAKVLAASFKAFLTDATSFYLAFINKLKDVYSLERVDEIVCKKLDVYATDGEGWEGGMYCHAQMNAFSHAFWVVVLINQMHRPNGIF